MDDLIRNKKITARIYRFLASAREQGAITTSMSINYFHSINNQLGDAEFAFREGKIDGINFTNKIDEVCKSYNIDFSYLIETVGKLDSLDKKPDQDKSTKLAQEIEARAIEEHEKRMNMEK